MVLQKIKLMWTDSSEEQIFLSGSRLCDKEKDEKDIPEARR